MSHKRLAVAVALLIAVLALGTFYAARHRLFLVAILMVHYVRSWVAPPGTLTTETAPGAMYAGPVAFVPSPSAPMPGGAPHDWRSYNRTLTSERYSPLTQIDRNNVATLKVLCTYDTKERMPFETGPIVVDGALIGTTDDDIFSIDAATCRENWRTYERHRIVSIRRTNRGTSYLDGLLYRGDEEGRVLAYDFRTGARVWATTIANAKGGETINAAPVAWNGLVFIGNAGGDNKGVKGRMYALDAKTGKIVWEFYLVPKGPEDLARGPQVPMSLSDATWENKAGTPITGGATWTSYTLDPETEELYVPSGNPGPDFAVGPRKGINLYSDSVVVLDARTGAYKRHFQVVPGDWHDWDVSNAPAIIQTRGGKRLLAVTPKDGFLYGFDLRSNALLYRVPVTRIENAGAPFTTDTAVHFCPGTKGGAEWNGPAYDPQSNLILIGEVEWCATVRLQTEAQIQAVESGAPWMAMAFRNPLNIFGETDSASRWAGWVYASDADTGAWKWRTKSNYPIVSGMTPTAGGIVFFGDLGGNFYALDTATGRRLWGENLGGAVGGGVITYAAGGAQKVAVATGFTDYFVPTKVVTSKIVILGLPGG
jgi:alcohol dehydrogenase (cytochrome c)